MGFLAQRSTLTCTDCSEQARGALSPSVEIPARPAVFFNPKPLAKIFRAAFKSRSSINPQDGHLCVRVDRDFFTLVQHFEQS